jgi:histone demethylase JARID1
MHTPMPHTPVQHSPKAHTPVAHSPMPHSPPPARFVEPEPEVESSTATDPRTRAIYLVGAAIGLTAGILYMLAG